MDGTPAAFRDERGMVLLSTLFVLAILIIFGTISIGTTIDELRVAGNDRANRVAFCEAESGLEFARARIRKGFLDATNKGAFVNNFHISPPDFSAPDDYDFTVAPLGAAGGAGTSDDPYLFTLSSTGRGEAGATETVVAMFRMVLVLPIKYAIYGDEKVKMEQNCEIYSYHSASMPSNPGSGDSTVEGDIFSNIDVIIGDNGWVEGDLSAGLNITSGTGTTVLGAPINGAPLEAGDPLGLLDVGGLLDFSEVIASNDNTAISSYVDTDLKLVINEPVDLPAGDYYFSEINLGNSARIKVSGEVNIYLDGPLDAGSNTKINMNGLPTNFAIYSRSTAPLTFWNSADMRGLIYAPKAVVEFKNSLTYYGAIYGREVIAKNNTTIWYDTAMKNKFLNSSSIPLKLAFWREE